MIERKYLAHYVDAAFDMTYADTEYVRLGKDLEEYSEEQNLKLVHDNFGDFSSTPSLYYIGEGKTQDMLLSSEEEVTLESYQTWLKENHIIEEDE